ncbi:MAG: nucleotidyltransferase domain-containing protein [Alphaproteobacteria bacterium]|nr:nucleotidyltransferase domain-containing protein [Alphaproteobacteria bacterium]
MKKINEVETNDIDMKPFNVKDKLNPEFFDKEGQLNSQIRLKLLDIADDFIDSLKIKWVKPSDIVLTGSIANYNWSKYSDVDIHIIYNYSDVYKKTDFVKDYFNSKKELWNSTHTELTIKDFPVEISVEDSSDPAKSTGVYSLEKNKWVKEPENMNDSKLNKEYIKKFCAKQMSKLDKLFDEMDNETDKVKIKKISDEIENLYTKLKDMRGEGLASSEKEMSTGNIIWKVIKHMGYIEKLWNYINNAYDRANTIDEKINGKIVRLSEAQAKLIKEGGNPGYGNIYLDSWLGRFKKALKNDTITTADLHSAIQRMGIKQVSPSVYNKKEIETILNDRRAQLRKLLGIEPLPEPVKPTPTRPSHFEQPQQPVPDNDDMPAANMENFINLSDVSELNEAAMPGFNLQTLSSIKSFAGRLKYCKQMLGPSFGSGSSRIIFEIDDEKVLKLAKNKKALPKTSLKNRHLDMAVWLYMCLIVMTIICGSSRKIVFLQKRKILKD